MRKANVAIVGCGNISSIYLENLTGRFRNVEVTAVCDLNPARLEFALGRLAEHRKAKPDNTYADIATFADGDEMFASGLIDAVIIAIPHFYADVEELSAEEREIGGLGIFIAKKTMDSISYAYENGENILTMIKKI